MQRYRYGRRATESPVLPKTPASLRRIITRPSEDQDGDVFPIAIQREADRVRLQNQVRLRIKELVKLRDQYSKGCKKWIKKCSTLTEQRKSNHQVDRIILQRLGIASSIINNHITQIDSSITKLTETYKTIPKKEQSKSLKSQLQRARVNVKRTKGDLDKCNKKRAQLVKQISRVETELTKRSLDKPERAKLQQKQQRLAQQRDDVDRDIQTAKRQHRQAIIHYDKNSNTILLGSQQRESECLQSMEELSQKFVNALQINSPSSSKATAKSNSSKNRIQSRRKNPSISSNNDD